MHFDGSALQSTGPESVLVAAPAPGLGLLLLPEFES